MVHADYVACTRRLRSMYTPNIVAKIAVHADCVAYKIEIVYLKKNSKLGNHDLKKIGSLSYASIYFEPRLESNPSIMRATRSKKLSES